MFKRFNTSSPWVWMSAGMLSLCLLSVLGVMLLIGWKGLEYFWPSQIYEFEIKTAAGSERYFGEIYDVEEVSSQQLKEAGVQLINPEKKTQQRFLIKIANRENEAHDFLSVLEQNILTQTPQKHLAVIERSRHGTMFAIPEGFIEDGLLIGRKSSHTYYEKKFDEIENQRRLLHQTTQRFVWLEHQIEAVQQKLSNPKNAEAYDLDKLYAREQTLKKKIEDITHNLARDRLVVVNRLGENILLPAEQLEQIWFPNAMSLDKKFVHWFKQLGRFISENPKEANSEGGVFPAIFGTVLMVLLMSVIVTPLGVLSAIYLHEYAKKNFFTRVIRIAVVNLAGVPSIVYGVFGLGFFVYFMGGSIDALFYADTLPRPTFGTPGLLWSSLTLAILTLPVVIVSTEEGLSRIPSSLRHASLALGATQAETLRKIVLPMVSPAIMTGLILAVARAAGEVAPLMLVGVVKVAPTLPLDGTFPYLHLDRKFMHLGYHIYDAGFQSPNSEAAKPLVYATSFLLITVIVSLNLTAILIRNHLREKYRALDADL